MIPKEMLPPLPKGPKRAQSAYLFFCAHQRPSLKEIYPEMKGTEIVAKLGELWRALEEDKKIPFQKQADEDKERFEREQNDVNESKS